MDIFALTAKIGLDSKEYEEGVGKAKHTFEDFANFAKKAAVTIGAAIGTAGAVVYKTTKQAVEAYGNYEQLVGGVETLFGAGGKSLEQFAETYDEASDNIYKYGQRGEDILELQKELIEQGYDLGDAGADGIYGPKTEKAMKAYQKQTGKTTKSAKAQWEKLKGVEAQVLANANKAYETAGLSANDYMETAISFSGALLRTLGNDTGKAAELTDMAIRDMADQANKYGKTVEDVSITYTSLSRGIYTTLDNLFGGMFAGTKKGLRDMLDYAENYQASLGNTVKYSEDSYADIVQALHDVSVATGVYQTTANEAAGTIQGSLNMTRAAWKNFITALGSGEELSTKIDQLVQSAKIALDNIKPIVLNALKGISQAIEEIVPIISAELPGILEAIVPSLLTAINSIIMAVVKAIPALLPILWQAVKSLLGELVNAISEFLHGVSPTLAGIFDTIVDIINNIFSGNWSEAWAGIVQLTKDAFDGISEWFTSTFNDVKTAVQDIDWNELGTKIWDWIKEAFDTASEWFTEKFNDVSTAISNIDWENVGTTIWDFIKGAFETVGEWFSEKFTEASNKIGEIDWKNLGITIWDYIKGAFDSVGQWFTDKFNEVYDGINGIDWAGLGKTIWDFIKSAFESIRGWFSEKFIAAKSAILEVDWYNIGTTIWTAISNAFTTISEWFTEKFNTASEAITSIQWEEVGTAIWDDIKAAFAPVAEWLSGKFDDATEAIREIDWGQLGRDIWAAIKKSFSKISSWFVEKFSAVSEDIKTGVEWDGLGGSIAEFIEAGFEAISTLLYNVLVGVKDSLNNDIDWHALGDSLATLIENGFSSLVASFTATGEDAEAGIRGINWWRLGFDIMVAILDGFGGVVQGMYDHAANAVREILGLEPDYRSAGQKAVDAIINEWDRLPPDAKKSAIKAAKNFLNPNDTDSWSRIAEIIGEDFADMLDGIPALAQTSGANAGDSFESEIKNGTDRAVSDVETIQTAIDALTGRTVTVTTNHIINEQTFTSSSGQSHSSAGGSFGHNASAMDEGKIFNHPTVFGYANGKYQVAGDVGAEAVVGARSLRDMVRQAVSETVGGLNAQMVAILQDIRNTMPTGDLVLDTGALVGGIADGMDAELNRVAAWKGGGRA